MSNPFQTALSTLKAASEVAGLEPNVVKMLSQPKRIFEFTIPMKMDNGDLEIFTAYRVHYNDALGQTKNGIRFVPNLDLDTVKALGFWMTVKHAVSGIPAGGGKGGIRVDPKKLSEGELERLTRSYIRKLPMKGAWVDIPGADIGTSAKTQGWMLDEYEEIMGFHSPAAINDKPAELNGTVGSMEATGTGAFFVTMEAVKDLSIPKGSTVVIQGFGNVGRIAGRLLHQEGYVVIAVSDISGGIYNPQGLDVEKLEAYVDETGSIKDFPGTTVVSNEALLQLECDILMPSAVQSVITEQNAHNIKTKLIMECANGPTTPAGEAILEKRGIIIVPDVLTNSGSAIVCSFERTQGLTDTYWDIETVNSKLKERIVKAYKETTTTAKDKNTSLRNAAWVNGLTKVAKAMKARGWV
ncbi:Glu/Leu/Phe/Val dehydrogenase, C terminal protein [Alkaliphilus metalliredigens QYMF]|uniref:Glutamate dehydrogenase n=1 Tax=Alkaliphilus metalliredigens (strain QYMF) TaxID=293826 RepID=A6TMI1_ALKMQ|nr:Glu/Leu/Phe/Val dehydrogenase [Alkaliphilus metalliredigens]ABR47399.1 Glu/Leu/Phe/Val dehydrogenase, C terminal protein [Alkaliphilus metalliredigens QYMF]